MPGTSEHNGVSSSAAAPAYLHLILSDFRVTNEFWGFYEYPDHQEAGREAPGYKATINAKWKHGSGSDRNFLNRDEDDLDLNDIWIGPTGDRAGTEQSRAYRQSRSLTIYLMEGVFRSLVEAIQHGDVERGMLTLKAVPAGALSDRLIIIFEDMEIVHKTFAKSEIIEDKMSISSMICMLAFRVLRHMPLCPVTQLVVAVCARA
jgi:hypothetical protein